MAPEMFPENGISSFGSDLWALGCVLYELAIGNPPFMSSSFTELVNMILKVKFKLMFIIKKNF